MSQILVDTDVFSFIFKNDTRAQLYQPHLDGRSAFLSFMTVAELYRWSLMRNWGDARIKLLGERINSYTVLPSSGDISWQWARLKSLKGKSMRDADAWIAATALVHGLPLATHNRQHFEYVPGLTLVSEA